MDYAAVYDRLMRRAQSRPQPDVFERHHVVPKCLGGSLKRENLALLTPREHLFAHKLLVRIHPENVGLWLALVMMGRLVQYRSKIFQSERIRAREIRKGFKYSQESRKKMSEAARARGRVSPKTEFKKGQKPWNAGLPPEQSHRFGFKHSPKTIAKMKEVQQNLREQQSVRMSLWWKARKSTQAPENERKIQ